MSDGSWRSWYEENVAGIGEEFLALIRGIIWLVWMVAAWWGIWRLAVKFFHWITSP